MRGKQDHTRERALRRNQTEAERILWQHLRNGRVLNYKFRRQHRIGPYYVDFYCAEAMLIIELDGSQHLDHSEYDDRRTRFLEAMGYRVQRIWNDEALENMDRVLDAIAVLLSTPHPPFGHPLPASGARESVLTLLPHAESGKPASTLLPVHGEKVPAGRMRGVREADR